VVLSEVSCWRGFDDVGCRYTDDCGGVRINYLEVA
jgi:hypothetical protein